MSDNNEPKEVLVPPEMGTAEQLPLVQAEVETVDYSYDAGKVFEKVLTLTQDRKLHEPTCPICCSIHRVAVEDAYKDRHKVSDAVKYGEENGFAITEHDIENHMRFHVDAAIVEIQKKEYIDRLQRLNSQGATTLDRLEMCMSVLMERLISINGMIPDNTTSSIEVEKIKSGETTKIMNAYKSLLNLQASILGEMEVQGKVVKIPINYFIKIFNVAFNKTQTDKEKELIQSILDGLKDAMVGG